MCALSVHAPPFPEASEVCAPHAGMHHKSPHRYPFIHLDRWKQRRVLCEDITIMTVTRICNPQMNDTRDLKPLDHHDSLASRTHAGSSVTKLVHCPRRSRTTDGYSSNVHPERRQKNTKERVHTSLDRTYSVGTIKGNESSYHLS